MPVIKSDEIKAILTGVIDTTVLADVFQSSFYDGHTAICLVDSADGNYALDTRYSTLGNAYDTPGPALLKGYENIDLKRALDQMNPQDKAVIELRYFEDMKIEDIAKVLDENVNTVKSRLYRGLKKLRLELTDAWQWE